MSLPALSRLRESLPGCEVALLIDVTTCTCLASAGAIQPNQAQLDKLCEEGAFFLGLDEGSGAAFCFVSGPLEIKAFAKAAAGQPEALCLVFAPRQVPEGLEARLFKFLECEALGGEIA
ncbi:MAG: hypothetical protein AAGF13_02610 [Pseudomonadota bacterium]